LTTNSKINPIKIMTVPVIIRTVVMTSLPSNFPSMNTRISPMISIASSAIRLRPILYVINPKWNTIEYLSNKVDKAILFINKLVKVIFANLSEIINVLNGNKIKCNLITSSISSIHSFIENSSSEIHGLGYPPNQYIILSSSFELTWSGNRPRNRSSISSGIFEISCSGGFPRYHSLYPVMEAFILSAQFFIFFIRSAAIDPDASKKPNISSINARRFILLRRYYTITLQQPNKKGALNSTPECRAWEIKLKKEGFLISSFMCYEGYQPQSKRPPFLASLKGLCPQNLHPPHQSRQILKGKSRTDYLYGVV